MDSIEPRPKIELKPTDVDLLFSFAYQHLKMSELLMTMDAYMLNEKVRRKVFERLLDKTIYLQRLLEHSELGNVTTWNPHVDVESVSEYDALLTLRTRKPFTGKELIRKLKILSMTIDRYLQI